MPCVLETLGRTRIIGGKRWQPQTCELFTDCSANNANPTGHGEGEFDIWTGMFDFCALCSLQADTLLRCSSSWITSRRTHISRGVMSLLPQTLTPPRKFSTAKSRSSAALPPPLADIRAVPRPLPPK